MLIVIDDLHYLAIGRTMRRSFRPPCVALALLGSLTPLGLCMAVDVQDVKEESLEAPHGVAIKVRMEGPYTAETPLQVVCYIKYTQDGARRMTGAPVELDKKLGGVIASLRERGEFEGVALETLLFIPPKGSIQAKAVLLVGLGEEGSLSLDRMERVGRVAVRKASRLGVRRVAFAPLIRDQGDTTLGAGDVGKAVAKGVLLAYDTEKRLQKEGLAAEWSLEEWAFEAGPVYFSETVVGVKRGISEARSIAEARGSTSFGREK